MAAGRAHRFQPELGAAPLWSHLEGVEQLGEEVWVGGRRSNHGGEAAVLIEAVNIRPDVVVLA